MIEDNRIALLAEQKEEADKQELIEAQKKLNKNFLNKFNRSR